MNKLMHTFWSSIKSNIWLIAAFFVPLSIRSIPELLSWPYPLGLDTLRYIPVIESGRVLSDALVFFKTQLFYSFGTLAYWLTSDGIVVIKILGPLLMGMVSVMMYLYAKRGLGWSGSKSFLVALLVATYFVTLRNSWDLYAQSFGLVFLLATLVVLKSSRSSWRFPVASVFVVLTVLSHELVSVILLIILGAEAIRFLVKKSRADFVFSVVAVGLGGVLFLFRHYSPTMGTINVLITGGAVEVASLARTLHMAGVMLYCFSLLLPFVIVGLKRLKDWPLRFWLIQCLGFVLLLMAFPDLPLYYWIRWVYLLVYPLLFFAVQGLDTLWKYWSNHKNAIRRRVPKIVAAGYVFLLLTLSGFYLVASSESQISFFAADNPYLTYIPSSMLQNTLPISDNPSFVACSDWINDNAVTDSVVVEHYALYDLATFYIYNKPIVNVLNSPSIWIALQNETSIVDGLISTSKQALADGNSTVYTVWWVSGKGWYQIPSLPSDFKEVYSADRMAVYVFDPTV